MQYEIRHQQNNGQPYRVIDVYYNLKEAREGFARLTKALEESPTFATRPNMITSRRDYWSINKYNIGIVDTLTLARA